MFLVYNINGYLVARFDDEDAAKEFVWKEAQRNNHVSVQRTPEYVVKEFYNGTGRPKFGGHTRGNAKFTSWSGQKFTSLEAAEDYAKKRNGESRSGMFHFVVVPATQED